MLWHYSYRVTLWRISREGIPRCPVWVDRAVLIYARVGVGAGVREYHSGGVPVNPGFRYAVYGHMLYWSIAV